MYAAATRGFGFKSECPRSTWGGRHVPPARLESSTRSGPTRAMSSDNSSETPDNSPSTDEGSRHSSRVSTLSPQDQVVPMRITTIALPQSLPQWWTAAQGLDLAVLQRLHDDILAAAVPATPNHLAQAARVRAI